MSPVYNRRLRLFTTEQLQDGDQTIFLSVKAGIRIDISIMTEHNQQFGLVYNIKLLADSLLFSYFC